MFSPLEQFENHYLLSLNLVGDSGFGVLTTVSVVSLFNTLLLLGVVWLGFSKPTVLLGRRAGVQTVVEAWWTILAGVVRQQLGHEQRFTALFVWLVSS